MKNLEDKIDDLTASVKRGFDGVEQNFEGLNVRLAILEQGQEEIKLRLDSKADRFEVKELDKRVSIVENTN